MFIKKLFLVLLAGGIMMNACKNEEKEMPNPSFVKTTWEKEKASGEWIFSKEVIYADSIPFYIYIHKNTGQKIFEMSEVNKVKDIPFVIKSDGQLFTTDEGYKKC